MTPLDNKLSSDYSLDGSPLDLMPDVSGAATVRAGDRLLNFISRKPMTALMASLAFGAAGVLGAWLSSRSRRKGAVDSGPHR